jgi:hypothetical protein
MPVPKKTAAPAGQVIASNSQWKLTCYTNHADDVTWILRKKIDAKGRESGYIEPYQDEALAFSACEKYGLKIEVRKS